VIDATVYADNTVKVKVGPLTRIADTSDARVPLTGISVECFISSTDTHTAVPVNNALRISGLANNGVDANEFHGTFSGANISAYLDGAGPGTTWYVHGKIGSDWHVVGSFVYERARPANAS
jgi:hypothetical protein